MIEIKMHQFMLVVGFITVLAFTVDEVIICNIFQKERKLLAILYGVLFLVSRFVFLTFLWKTSAFSLWLIAWRIIQVAIFPY